MEVLSQNHGHGFGNVNSEKARVVVVMVPFPAQSHLNQLLQLACLISTFDVPVYYACSSIHIRQAKLRFNGMNPDFVSKIQFHEFPTPSFLSPPPNPNSLTRFPSHLQPSFESSVQLRKPVAALMRKISPTAKRLVVVHDVLMANVVQDIASVPNGESYALNPTCAFTSFNGWLRRGKVPFQVEVPKGLPSMEGCYTSEFLEFAALNTDPMKLTSGVIFNSCRSIEGAYLDFLATLHRAENRKLWAIGPLNLHILGENITSKCQNKCLEWLDKQEPKSVLYVSFGTTSSMSSEQIKEIAIGLEESKQKFIWVLREADKGDIFAGDEGSEGRLPEGYEERVKEFGIVVRDWAPQLEILGHPSTGGFMSHCGWNSCLESISMGVPIAAWPMHSDQPKNAFFVTDILKSGLTVNKWEEREELLCSPTIARMVKCLMVSKEGEEMRKRAEEFSGAIQQAVKGGDSRAELDSFIAHITR